jgi:hypothetical protein
MGVLKECCINKNYEYIFYIIENTKGCYGEGVSIKASGYESAYGKKNQREE